MFCALVLQMLLCTSEMQQDICYFQQQVFFKVHSCVSHYTKGTGQQLHMCCCICRTAILGTAGGYG